MNILSHIATKNIRIEHHWLPHYELGVTIVLTQFNVDTFKQTWYQEISIELPERVAQSVKARLASFFFGRLCAYVAISLLNRADTWVGIGCAGDPIWPQGLIGSITHTSTTAAATVIPTGTYSGIGIDIEEAQFGHSMKYMIGQVVFARETKYLNSLVSRFSIDVLLLLVFSAKESFYKGAYGQVQRFFGFEAVEVSDVDFQNCIITLVLQIDLCDQFLRGDEAKVTFKLLSPMRVMTVFLT